MSEPLDLERIKAYCEKATAGPWWIAQSGYNCTGPRRVAHENKTIEATDSVSMSESNMDFIANARTDLPAAIAEIAELRRELAQAKGERDNYQASMGMLAEDAVKTQAEIANLKSDRDKALRVAEEKEQLAGALRVEREQALGVSAYARKLADTAQSDLSACRAILDDMRWFVEKQYYHTEETGKVAITSLLARLTTLKAGQPVWGDKERLDWLGAHVMASGTVTRGWKLFFYSPHHDDIRAAIDAAAKQEGSDGQ